MTTNGTSYGTLTEGVSTSYDIAIAQDGNSIVADISKRKRKTDDETKLIVDGPIASSHLINKGTDQLIHDFDFDDIEPLESGKINDIIFNGGGTKDRVRTGKGAILRNKGTNYDLGFGRTISNAYGKLFFAPVVEHGHGNYHNFMKVNGDNMHGSGDCEYTAGGFIIRQFNTDGMYYEGSFRFGRTEFDFGSSDFDYDDRVNYKTHAPMFAGHVRIGNLKRLNKNNILHCYGIYSYMRQNGSNARLSSGETYEFDSINSNRFRLGYKLTSKISPVSYIYTGMAYMFEVNPNSNAIYRNKDMRTPKSGESGSSGMLELGWQIKPLRNNPWALDLNATGWIGQQKGITAMAKMKKTF